MKFWQQPGVYLIDKAIKQFTMVIAELKKGIDICDGQLQGNNDAIELLVITNDELRKQIDKAGRVIGGIEKLLNGN